MIKKENAVGLISVPHGLHQTMDKLVQAQLRTAKQYSEAVEFQFQAARRPRILESIHDSTNRINSLYRSANFSKANLHRQKEIQKKLRASLIETQRYENMLGKLFAQIPKERRTKMYMAMQFWPIRDNRLIRYLVRREITKDGLGEAITSYYKEKKWEELRKMVCLWKPLGIDEGRHKILKDCLEILIRMDGDDVNAANVLLPTLVCQFEGIIDDTDGVSKKAKGIKTMMQLSPSELNSNTILLGIIVEVFGCSTAFANDKAAGKHRINLNRHKLNHGEKILLDYGSEENVIRLFIYINEVIRFSWEEQSAINSNTPDTEQNSMDLKQ